MAVKPCKICCFQEIWRPFISDGQILSWLVKIPSDSEQMVTRQTFAQKIYKLDDIWEKDDRENPGVNDDPAQALFSQVGHYHNF